jgi:hypothetical protein
MKLFFAGNLINADPQCYTMGIRRKLLSYAGIADWEKASFQYWIRDHPMDTDIFLDSGAFSAYTRGAVINLRQYCDFIHQYKHNIHCYAALDVVGGNWIASERNLLIMLKKGLDPIAVYHHQDPHGVLEHLLKRHKFIALGGMVGTGVSRDDMRQYLDRCFDVIGKYWPVKVHGFGIMAQWALERYPFYSVDSSSAIVSAGMGHVVTFDFGRVESHDWREYGRRMMDGTVMDHVAIDRAKKGSAHMGRRAQNIRAQIALEEHVTRLWTKRGITW